MTVLIANNVLAETLGAEKKLQVKENSGGNQEFNMEQLQDRIRIRRHTQWNEATNTMQGNHSKIASRHFGGSHLRVINA